MVGVGEAQGAFGVDGDVLDPAVAGQLQVARAAQPGLGDDQAALGADQLQLVAAGQVEGDVELGQDAGGELQGDGHPEVDPGVAVEDPGGGDAGGVAGEQADGADAVAAEVAEGAPTEGDRAADVVRGDTDTGRGT
jgi:hypothetical protein